MKFEKKEFWIELFTQLVVLAIFGVSLFWVFRNRALFMRLGPFSVLRYLLPLSFGVYLILIIVVARNIFSDYFLTRYDPADTDSVNALGKIQRYKIKGGFPLMEESNQILRRYLNAFAKKKAKEVARGSFGVVFERPATTPFQALLGHKERLILLYRPILNVLIADRLLSEASEYILRTRKPDVRRNVILMISDMNNDTEMLSTACGVVNYLVRVDNGKLLYPFLLDLHHGRIFYPQDKSSMTWADQYYFSRVKNGILQVLHADKRGGVSRVQAPQAPAKQPPVRKA